MGFMSSLFGGGSSKFEDVKIPDYQEDKYYESSQAPLQKTGLSLLEGKPNDYFKPIGEYGGQEFENVLGLLKRDVSTGVNEDLVRRGVGRGGIGATAQARAIGDISTKTRYADYERAMAGRQNLLNTGADILGGVRSGALNREGIRNPFELQRTGLDMQKAGALDAFQTAKDNKLSDLIGGAIGLAAPFVMPGIGSALGGLFGGAGGGLGASSIGSSSLLGAGGNPLGYTGLPAGF